MEIKLLTNTEAAEFLKYPLLDEPSLVRSMNGQDFKLKKIRQTKNYGCRHCLNAQQKLGEDENSANASEGQVSAVQLEDRPKKRANGLRVKKEKVLFSYDGLVSHLKAK